MGFWGFGVLGFWGWRDIRTANRLSVLAGVARRREVGYDGRGRWWYVIPGEVGEHGRVCV